MIIRFESLLPTLNEPTGSHTLNLLDWILLIKERMKGIILNIMYMIHVQTYKERMKE